MFIEPVKIMFLSKTDNNYIYPDNKKSIIMDQLGQSGQQLKMLLGYRY